MSEYASFFAGNAPPAQQPIQQPAQQQIRPGKARVQVPYQQPSTPSYYIPTVATQPQTQTQPKLDEPPEGIRQFGISDEEWEDLKEFRIAKYNKKKKEEEDAKKKGQSWSEYLGFGSKPATTTTTTTTTTTGGGQSSIQKRERKLKQPQQPLAGGVSATTTTTAATQSQEAQKPLPANLKKLNQTFNFINQLGRLGEENETARQLIERDANEEERYLTAKPNNGIDLETLSRNNRNMFVSLRSLAQQDGVLFLVFDPNEMPPLTSIEDIVQISQVKLLGAPPFYLTNDYSKTDPTHYVAVVKLTSNVLPDAISIAVGKTGQEVEKLRQQSQPESYGWIEQNIETKEYRIVLPHIIRSRLKIMTTLFELEKHGIVPIVPLRIQKLVSSDESIRQTYIKSGRSFLNNVDDAFHEKHKYIGNDTSVVIETKTGLYHYSGNSMFPKGSHTNLTSNNILINEDTVNENERAILLDFYQKYPAFDSITMSTRPPVTASTTNGITLARYFATDDILLNGKNTTFIDKVYNLFVFAGSHTNERFLMNITELCARINFDKNCEKTAIVIWSTVPRNSNGSYGFMQKLNEKSNIDIITFHHQQNKEISDAHLWLYTAQRCEQGALPPLIWEIDYPALFTNDLLRATPYGKNPNN